MSLVGFKAFRDYKGDLTLSIQQMKLDPKSVHLPDYLDEYFTITKGGFTSSSI